MPEANKPDSKAGDLQLEYAPAGRNGTAVVTARLAGDVLAVESLNLAKSKQREAFAATVAKDRPGIDATMVEAELMRAAAELADRSGNNGEPADWANLPELDVSQVVRPERFVTPEVSGLAIPTTRAVGDRVTGRWSLYLRWADGRRERRDLGPVLDLPDGGRLFVHPQPCEPTPTMRPGWSADARKRWLAGEPTPDAANVFKGLCRRIAHFLDLPRAEAPGVTATLACWIVHTYVFLAWPATPYLYVGGPLGSGKSRVFEILNRLVFRPLNTSSLTGPALFRTLHAQGGTVLLDEAERLRDTRSPDVAELVSALLAGHREGGRATRLEPIGESGFRTVSFDVYSPKALAAISGPPPALASRCVRIGMFRAGPGSEKPRRRIDAEPGKWQRLRDDLHALALEHGPNWLRLVERSEVCPAMSGRDFDKWQPLLALASWIEEAGALGLLKLLQDYALQSIDAGRDDQTPDHDEIILRALAEAVRLGERPTAGDLLKQVQEAEPVAFKNWSARAVTSHLKRYGIPTPRKSMGRRAFRDVTLDHLRRIQDSYGIDLDLPEPATVPSETKKTG